MLVEIASEIPVVPLLEITILPLLSVIVPDIEIIPELFEILILPVSLAIALDIVKPFNDEILISPVLELET